MWSVEEFMENKRLLQLLEEEKLNSSICSNSFIVMAPYAQDAKNESPCREQIIMLFRGSEFQILTQTF